jgi:hypothetical protein
LPNAVCRAEQPRGFAVAATIDDQRGEALLSLRVGVVGSICIDAVGLNALAAHCEQQADWWDRSRHPRSPIAPLAAVESAQRSVRIMRLAHSYTPRVIPTAPGDLTPPGDEPHGIHDAERLP